MKNSTKTPRNKNRGFTLLEVMVAQVIFSVGLLGLAGLMTQSLSFNNSSKYRTQATFLAYDILERMRNNQMGVEDGRYNISFGAAIGSNSCYDSNGTVNCNSVELATADTDQWRGTIQHVLPSADGSILTTTTVAGATTFDIVIQWSDSSSSSPSSYQLTAEL